jgi:hypothetical protein
MRGLLERPGGSGVPGDEVRPEGTRASANTSGPDFIPGFGPVKLRVVKDTRTERRKPVSSAGPVLKERASFERTLFRNTIQPFDLMSRRHPLSSTRAFRLSSGARVTCRHQAAGNSRKKRSYFFFFATLRVFFAVFFTALFAFFAFLAFLAMLPS